MPGRTMQSSTLYLDGPDGPLEILTEDLGDNRIAADLQGVLAECTEETTWWLKRSTMKGPRIEFHWLVGIRSGRDQAHSCLTVMVRLPLVSK